MADVSAAKVVIVGGGLAGMSAALELVRRGCDVTMYEASDRLGGKAGSERTPRLVNKLFKLDSTLKLPEGVDSDHGYHVFPLWYTNMRRLWEEIPIPPSDVFNDMAYTKLMPTENGVRTAFTPVEGPDLRQLLGICELVLQPDSHVDEVTLQGFLYSRDFHRDRHPINLNEFVLNALTIGEARISSRCARDVFRQWVPSFGQPNWNGLRGSLQRVLIDRLEAHIRRVADNTAGARFTLLLNTPLTALATNKRGTPKLTFGTGANKQQVEDALVVLALPFDRLRTLLAPGDFVRVPEIPAMHSLHANVFSALDVHFEHKLANIPAQHFRLEGSTSRLTGLEISQHWPELQRDPQQGSVMQFVMADSKRFLDLDDATFVRVVAREIQGYLPEVGTDAVKFYVPHRNTHAPLFINEVGSWQFRPNSRAALAGLYFAGDFVRNETDVASMEGAVRTGLMAAEALRADHIAAAPPVEIRAPANLQGARAQIIEAHAEDPVLARMQFFVATLQELAATQAAARPGG